MNTMLNVWWMVREDAKVSVDVADEILGRYGFKGLMGEVTERKAVRRGIDELHNRRGNNRRVVERVSEDADKVVFGVLKMNVDAEAQCAEYDQDTTVILDKATGVVNATGAVAEVVNQKIQMNRGVYNDNDIRALCGNVIRLAGGVSKRPTGGVYVVPAFYADKVKALKSALAEMCGDAAVIYTERIYDGEEERENTAVAVANDLTSRVNLIVTAVGKLKKQTCRIKNHQMALAKVEEITKMYSGILGEQIALKSLTDTLEMASKKIETVLEETLAKANA